MPTPARKNTPKRKGTPAKAKTPQSAKKKSAGTPKSATPSQIKRKLEEEVDDDQLSDADFDALLGDVEKKKTPMSAKSKAKSAKATPIISMKGDDDDDDDESDEDMSDDLEFDDSEDDGSLDDGADSDEDDVNDAKKTKSKPTKKQNPGTKKQASVNVTPKAKPSKKEKVKPDNSKKAGGVVQADTLFIQNIPKVSPTEVTDTLKKLCPKSIQVQVPGRRRKGKEEKVRGFALIKFKNEGQAKEGMKKLQGVKIGERVITVATSVLQPRSFDEKLTKNQCDPRRLYISGSCEQITKDNMKALFPTAASIKVPEYKYSLKMSGYAYAFVKFSTADECSKVKEENQDATVAGNSIVVQFAKKMMASKRKRKEAKKGKSQPAAKKQKKASTTEEEDSEDDDMDLSDLDEGGDSEDDSEDEE